MKANLILEDGSVFEGVGVGDIKEGIGEVVINTAVVGYQEIMTDPSNAGKIMVLTYPLIGNYGVARKFDESRKCWLSGLVIKEPSRIYSNWQAEGSFKDFLIKEGVGCIADADTRTIAVTIREKGEMRGIISTGKESAKELMAKITAHNKNSFIKDTSVKKITEMPGGAKGPKVAVLDLGIPNSFLKQLKALGCDIVLLPYDTPAGDIISVKPDGLIISSGPENDEAAPKIAETVKAILGKIPMLGISAGHEIIGMALGCAIEKMKLGHRGVNYPVKNPNSFKGEITVQNHSFVINSDSIKNKKNVTVTLRNLNDDSIEEMESRQLRFISAQYYPASPGLNEVNALFIRFLNMACPGKHISRKNETLKYTEVAHAKT